MHAARLPWFLGVMSPGLFLALLMQQTSLWHVASDLGRRVVLPHSAVAARIVSTAAKTAGPSSLLMYRGYVAQATVLVVEKSCTGFVASEPDLIVTAAHCIPPSARAVTVITARNERFQARLVSIDRNTDLTVMRLPRPLDIPPLPLAATLPSPSEPLLFAGRGDRPGSAQIGSVQKLGRCPSLPHVAHAIFTSIDASPGDSGAPVLDSDLRVVGIVHGGARCHILAPVAPLARQFEDQPPDTHSQA